MAVLDFLQGYHKLSLHEDTQHLTMFINVFGRFMFCRVPMGSKSSEDDFCRITNKFLSGLGEFLVKQVNNVLVLGVSWDDIEKKTRKVLEEARENGSRVFH